MLLNLSLIAGDALVRGGQLDIGAERRGDGIDIAVRAEGVKVVLDPELRNALTGNLPRSGVSSRTSAAWMTAQLVRQAGGEIMLSPAGEPSLVFGASIPV